MQSVLVVRVHTTIKNIYHVLFRSAYETIREQTTRLQISVCPVCYAQIFLNCPRKSMFPEKQRTDVALAGPAFTKYLNFCNIIRQLSSAIFAFVAALLYWYEANKTMHVYTQTMSNICKMASALLQTRETNFESAAFSVQFCQILQRSVSVFGLKAAHNIQLKCH